MTYEFIREIFNKCSGNQMRDVFVSEIESDNLDEYIKQFLIGGSVSCKKNTNEKGNVIIYDLDLDGLKERLSFTMY
ncbi:MAG: hypothetical protein Ta2F_09680 [Termitinemataceae bacterium]|nr:MAG: hypothetical protein Ta2F_09680 [Termitinemataceae bacterium]